MTSPDLRKGKPTTFSAPRDLTPPEIESLRANKRELTRTPREIRACHAAEPAATAKAAAE